MSILSFTPTYISPPQPPQSEVWTQGKFIRDRSSSTRIFAWRRNRDRTPDRWFSAPFPPACTWGMQLLKAVALFPDRWKTYAPTVSPLKSYPFVSSSLANGQTFFCFCIPDERGTGERSPNPRRFPGDDRLRRSTMLARGFLSSRNERNKSLRGCGAWLSVARFQVEREWLMRGGGEIDLVDIW